MTSAPADLLAFQNTVLHLTGLAADAVGIVGDGAHQRTGGYHEGRDVLTTIGRYHPGAAPGTTSEDYSCRLARDRRGLTNDASAMDIGDNWPHGGGRAAWLRYNTLLVANLRAGDSDLAPLRAVNYSPDGVRRLRVDRQLGFATETSSDSVDSHTHHEWYRDTAGHRAACLNRLAQLIAQAAGQDLEGDMLDLNQQIPSIKTPDVPGRTLGDYLHDTWHRAQIDLPATLAGLNAKLDALVAAVHALSAGGTSVDTAAVISAVNQAGAAESVAVAALRAQVADLTARLAAAGHALDT